MLVVPVELCKGFLKDWHPEGTIARDFGERSGVDTLFRHVVPLFVDGQPIVNDYSVFDTQGVQVDSVDASGVKLWVLVEEHGLDASWSFSDGGCCGHEPAISNDALADIHWGDAVLAPQVLEFFLEEVLGAFPFDAVTIVVEPTPGTLFLV